MSLEQVRVFLSVVEEGNFSAAARRLGKTQSAISHAIANLERSLGFDLFDRSGRLPVLTDAGRGLVREAQDISSGVARFHARATSIASGTEAEVAIAVDALFPISAVAHVLHAFREEYPAMPLLVRTEALGAAEQAVRDGDCSIGICGRVHSPESALAREKLGEMEMVTVVAPNHALAGDSRAIPRSEAERHNQLVLTDRSKLSGGHSGVLGGDTWRINDLCTKHVLLASGLGWGNMPLHMVRDDLAAGRLVRIRIADWAEPMQHEYFVIHRPEAPPGPAATWIIDRVRTGCAAAPT